MSQATHWKTREEVCSVKPGQNFKSTRGRVTNICKNISRVFDATWQKFNKKVASGEEVDILTRKLSQSLVEDAHSQTLHTTNRSGAYES